MKRIVLFLLVAMIAAGAVWGQAMTPNSVDTKSAMKGVALWDFFVDETKSTEKRYSAGIFGSYADDFLWFTGWDANVGTFLLLGGYPDVGNDYKIDETNYLMTGKYVLNFGFAKSFSKGYLGVYYGGDLVEASGSNNGMDGSDNYWDSTVTWKNRIAILYGREGLGGIRFDMLLDSSKYTDSYTDNKSDGFKVTNAPSIAVGWGNSLANGMDVYAQLGYRFGNMTIDVNPADKAKKDTIWTDARLALQAGIWKPLAVEGSSLSVDFVVGGVFGGTASGDYNYKDTYYTKGGIFQIGAEAAYKQVIDVDKLSLGFKPIVGIGFTSDDSDSYIVGSKTLSDLRKRNDFELTAGVDVGVKYQATDKIALYTGLGLTIFDWKAAGYVEGKDDKYDKNNNKDVKSHAWHITGLEWNKKQLANQGHLGFGLTFAPTPNIVIGTGLNALLDKIVYVDLAHMQVGTGLNTNTSASELGWLSDNIFGGLKFDLTITAKF
jgi:hypothetical protein